MRLTFPGKLQRSTEHERVSFRRAAFAQQLLSRMGLPRSTSLVAAALLVREVAADDHRSHELDPSYRHKVRHDARAFYQRSWHPEHGCPNMRRVGNTGDGGKVLCDPALLQNRADCLVVSVGSHSDFSFEADVHALAPHCHIDTYDGTLKKAQRLKVPAPSFVNFFSLSMDAQSYQRYLGRRVDVLKVDCEGCEFTSLVPWVAHVCTESILLELHSCHKHPLSRVAAVDGGRYAQGSDAPVIAQTSALLKALNGTHAIYSKEPNLEWSDGRRHPFAVPSGARPFGSVLLPHPSHGLLSPCSRASLPPLVSTVPCSSRMFLARHLHRIWPQEASRGACAVRSSSSSSCERQLNGGERGTTVPLHPAFSARTIKYSQTA